MKMKKLQKVISIFVVICMICALAVTTVLASGGPTLTVESVEAGRGDTVTIAVAAANNPGFTNFEWNIIYDKEKLVLESINSSRKIVVENEVVEVQFMNGYTVVSNLNHKDTGYGYITSAAAEAKALNTTLFTLTFAVKDNAKAGLAAVSIDSDCVADAGASVEFAYVAGGVMVLDNTTGGSTTGGSTTGGSTTGGSTTGGSTTGGSTTGDSIIGDFDGDNKLTDADAVYLLMHTLWGEKYPINNMYADFNKDGSITDADAVYLLMHTLFGDKYPLSGGSIGGSTTGGSTTGGSTTGGSTTGGSTTGGSTTGGSTTGGSTTGGSMTDGSTT